MPEVATLLKAKMNQMFMVHNKEACQTLINIFKFSKLDE